MNISIGAENVSEGIKPFFLLKTSKKIGTEGNSLNLIKNVYETPHLTLHCMMNNRVHFP